ncbi:sodium:solute symporter family transporter [Scopulibacillus cellulosilyticus]|uniref:Sodium:solute symporter n=1 Tax=Scopulibacillus cellulosilyticus TaxID=2665665 RepID=A0ABW2Q329_9BACL
MSDILTDFDFVIIFAYFAVLIGVGVFSSRRIKSKSDFLVAGKRLGYGLYVPAMSAVVLGGASTFGSTALGYQYGISGMWLVGMIGLGILGMGIFFSKKLSDLNVFSVSELLATRFGKSSRLYSALIMAVYDMMVAVVAIIAMGEMFSSMFHWNKVISIIIGGAIVIFYTMLGGMWAVTLTDVIQFWVMTIGLLLILLPLSIFHAGGIESAVHHLKPGALDVTRIGGKAVFSYFLLYFFGMMIGQDVWQRAFTSKNKSVMRNGTVMAGLYCIIYGIAGAVIGMMASLLLPHLHDPQKALPDLILNILPTGLIGLVIAAIASAIMSTASGTIMASSTIIVNDFILPFRKSKTGDLKEVKLVRLMNLIVGAVAILIAAALQNVVDALNVAYALLTGSILLPVIAALFWKSVSKKVIMASMVISSLIVVLDLIIEGISSLNPIIYGLISGIIVMIIGVLFVKKDVKEDAIQEANVQDKKIM